MRQRTGVLDHLGEVADVDEQNCAPSDISHAKGRHLVATVTAPCACRMCGCAAQLLCVRPGDIRLWVRKVH